MKKLLYLGIAGVFTLFVSCGGDGDHTGDETDIDSLDTITEDTLIDSLLIDTGQYVDDDSTLSTEIEKIYGKQWDFCDCVVKNDSVNEAIENGDDNTDYDFLLVRMEEIDQHCKEMLTTDNRTPEEREAHERKVRKCLKNK